MQTQTESDNPLLDQWLALQPTAREIRYTIRRRKMWHKVFRWTYYGISGLVLFAVVFVATVVFRQAQKRLAHQNSVEAIQAVARSGTQPAFFISANEFIQPYIPQTEEGRLAAVFADNFMEKGDSLGLTDSVRLGIDLQITVVPCGLFGKRHSAGQAKLYTSPCGCDTDSLIDETVIQLDSIGKASVTSSRKVALVRIQP